MAPVVGKPFLEWVIRYLAQQGVTRMVISAGHLARVVEDHFQACPIPGIHLQCVVEPTPLGTGGGFLYAARASREKPAAWLVLNGDSLVFAQLADLITALTDPTVGGALVGRIAPNAERYGAMVVGAEGKLNGFSEKRAIGEGIINAGIYLFRRRLLARFPKREPLSLEQEVFPALLAQGVSLQVCLSHAPFLDIGTPESLAQAALFIQQNRTQFF